MDSGECGAEATFAKVAVKWAHLFADDCNKPDAEQQLHYSDAFKEY